MKSPFFYFSSMKKAQDLKNKKKKRPSSLWTPDISIDGFQGSRDDEIIEKLGSKLGYKEGESIPQEFVADGLDSLLSIPRYNANGPNHDRDVDVPVKASKKSGKKSGKEEERDESEKKVRVKKHKGEPKKVVVAASEEEEEELEDEEGHDDADPEAVLEALKKQKEMKQKQQAESGSVKKKVAVKGAEEIDALFDELKSKKEKNAAAKKKKKDEDRKHVPSRGSGGDDGFAGRSLGGGRKYTEEGYPIYTEEELKLNMEGGDTPDCPFDCNCCF